MKKSRRLVFLLAVLFTLFSISACGVSKDEHEKVIIELEQTKAELEQAKAKIAEIEKSMELTQIDTEVMEKLRSAQQKAGDLSARVKTLTMENEQLRKDLEEIRVMK